MLATDAPAAAHSDHVQAEGQEEARHIDDGRPVRQLVVWHNFHEERQDQDPIHRGECLAEEHSECFIKIHTGAWAAW